ncbi:MAG: 3-hydroxybutyryl-CoA dehydrogenase [Candidatus Zixiibacteriota bacterium]
MAIRKVGIVGCGLMGSGIAQVSAQAGYDVVVREVTDELFQKGYKRIEGSLGKFVAKEKITQEECDKILGRIRGTTSLADLRDCDLIIEAIIENFEEKTKIYAELDTLCGPDTIFASNTSSLPIGDMSAVTNRRDRFVGLHFFNPVPIMKLVEVVRALDTSDRTYTAVKAFAESVGKTVVTAKDTPGFVVNVLLVPYLLDAVRLLENGVASAEDIDNGMKLGCGHPMGPLTLLDFVGLDTTYYIAEIMFSEFKDSRYAAPPLLKRLVKAGYHGKKAGRGIYTYNES